MYTGLPVAAVLLLVSLLSRLQLKYVYGWSVSCISLTDQVLLTLMKLRLNMPTLDLAARFNCSTTTVSNVFITITAALHEILIQYFMQTIPSTNKNRACLPECFSSFCNCRVIYGLYRNLHSSSSRQHAVTTSNIQSLQRSKYL